MANDALRSRISLCRGGLDAACAAALVLARANLASCTLTGGSGRASWFGEILEMADVAGDVAASRTNREVDASILSVSRAWCQVMFGTSKRVELISERSLFVRACVRASSVTRHLDKFDPGTHVNAANR